MTKDRTHHSKIQHHPNLHLSIPIRISVKMQDKCRRIQCILNHLSNSSISDDSQDVALPLKTIKANQTSNKSKKKKKNRLITKDEIIEAREEGKVWIVLKHNKVYDVTEFLDEHPGGAELITDIDAGDFKTQRKDFDDAEHSDEAMDDLKQFLIGRLAPGENENDGEEASDEEKEEGEEEDDDDAGDEGGDDDDDGEEEGEEEEDDDSGNAKSKSAKSSKETKSELANVDPTHPFATNTTVSLPLIDKANLSHDVVVFRFGFRDPNYIFGLPIGQHIILSFTGAEGKVIKRAYTPVSPAGEKGFFDLLVKLYPTGKMSNYLLGLKIGDKVDMQGPKGKLAYIGNGAFSISPRRNGPSVTKKLIHVGMICGGSGLTPMFQILQSVFGNKTDQLKITLLYANKTIDDILLKDTLDEMAKLRPGQIKVHYTLDRPPKNGWTHKSGFVTKEMIQQTMPAPSDSSMIFLCGPPPMIKKACIPNLKALGYKAEQIFTF